MTPALLPGDRLAVVAVPRWWPVRAGALVVFADPRLAAIDAEPRLFVKRVVKAEGDYVEVLGDNAAASTDGRDFGPVPRDALLGLALYRYAPRTRSGLLR